MLSFKLLNYYVFFSSENNLISFESYIEGLKV